MDGLQGLCRLDMQVKAYKGKQFIAYRCASRELLDNYWVQCTAHTHTHIQSGGICRQELAR